MPDPSIILSWSIDEKNPHFTHLTICARRENEAKGLIEEMKRLGIERANPCLGFRFPGWRSRCGDIDNPSQRSGASR